MCPWGMKPFYFYSRCCTNSSPLFYWSAITHIRFNPPVRVISGQGSDSQSVLEGVQFIRTRVSANPTGRSYPRISNRTRGYTGTRVHFSEAVFLLGKSVSLKYKQTWNRLLGYILYLMNRLSVYRWLTRCTKWRQKPGTPLPLISL